MSKKSIYFVLLLLPISLLAQNVGIGTTNPAEKLHVAGNLQFDGALMPAGLPGAVGQALTSQGPAVPPIWQSPTLGQQFSTVYTTNSVAIAFGNSYTLIPGLSTTITVPAVGTYDLYIFTDGGAQFNDNLNTNRGAQLEISIWVDGVAVRYITSVVDNVSNFVSSIRNWATSFYTTLAPGPHSVEIYGRHRSSTVAQTITVGAPNVVGNYLISSLTVGLIKR